MKTHLTLVVAGLVGLAVALDALDPPCPPWARYLLCAGVGLFAGIRVMAVQVGRDLLERAEREERILRRLPTPITNRGPAPLDPT